MLTRFRQLKMTVLFVAVTLAFILNLCLFAVEVNRAMSDERNKTAARAVQEVYYNDYHDSSGVMYQNSSEFFDFKIEPATLSKSEDGYFINYQLIVFNKSSRDFKNAHLVFGLDDQMGKYLTSGVVEYPGARADLCSISSNIAGETQPFACRMDAEYQLPLTNDLDVHPLAYVYSALEEAKKINVSVYWDNGSESHSFITRLE